MEEIEMNFDINLDDDFDFDGDMFVDGMEDEKTYQFARIKRYNRPICVKYDIAAKAAKDIGRLEPGDFIDMIVSGNFIAGDFIEAYLAENKLVAEEIIISTLSLSRENVDSLKNVKDYMLSGIMGLIVSDYFFANERKTGIEDIIKHLAGDDFYLAVAGIHTKITIIKTQCGMHLVIAGSANLRSSLNIEQITIMNDETVYNFHRQWMAKILNEYHVHHEMLRREKLWRLVQKDEGQRKMAAGSGERQN